ncbi:MAG: Crp/Fnr family transcriptional regulator [Gammaproteobacteria bacterium]
MSGTVDQVLANRNGAELEHHISVAELFRGSGNEEIALLARHASLYAYQRGEMVFQRGERPTGLLLVAEGTLKLAVRGVNGEQKIIALIEEGQSCASALAFLDRPSALEASALTPVTIVSIPANAVFAAMQSDAELAQRVVEHLSHRVLSLVDEVEGITLRTGLQRLAGYVESLARERGNGSHAVRLPATKTLIAAQLGIAKETLSRLLHELVEKGVISVARRELFILDHSGLAAVARGEGGNGNGRAMRAAAAVPDASLGAAHK